MKIAIAGYGIEGEANYRYWNSAENDVTIVDENAVPAKSVPQGAQTLLGPGVFSQLKGYDMVIRTASLAPQRIHTDGKVWSSTNEFFARCPAPIIGVTGTKGKGTTSSFVASILRAAGKTVHLVGNIGLPALSVLQDITSDDVVVYELSSFQLWDLEYSPQTAVILMIEPDHQDVHADMEDYVSAKMNIIRHQDASDRILYTPGEYDEMIYDIAGRTGAKPCSVPSDKYVHIADDTFYYQDQPLAPLSDVKLPGEHNLHNAAAAIAATLPYVEYAPEVVSRGLRDFTGLPHRLKLVGEVDGVRFYDDSIATTPGSALAAIRSIDGAKLLILGGVDKGGDYTSLMQECARTNTTVMTIGSNSATLAELCSRYEVSSIPGGTTMSETVNRAYEYAQPMKMAIILSPAAASFDMFRNYQDRGEQFIAAIDRLVAS